MFYPFFDIWYFIILAPALLLMVWAQFRIKHAYSAGQQVPAGLSGAATARRILDAAGLQDVEVESTTGHLSDHYDPTHHVLRLSNDVYQGRNAAAVGIAAHEAGHALQHAQNYGPMALRQIAVPAAQFGPIWFMVFLVLGMFVPLYSKQLLWLAVGGFAAAAIFQLINLPVEIDASNRAKRLLTEMGIVDLDGSSAVRNVLNAAAWTYVAATLQSILLVVYYIFRLGLLGGSRSDD
ncbi:zinc metallopeptidase [Planctomicrobium sp. SH664]|uniref:zinc metallopeptidase n=1 Tax=Planctomicrobium sp. SH664 TaxID=3448125 RepID=UPI003F5B53D6